MKRMEKMAWKCFAAVGDRFLGNHKAKNYEQLVQTFIETAKMGCRMSLKVHILHTLLDKFKDMGAYSEEQGMCFQDIWDFENYYYQGQYNKNMMG